MAENRLQSDALEFNRLLPGAITGESLALSSTDARNIPSAFSDVDSSLTDLRNNKAEKGTPTFGGGTPGNVIFEADIGGGVNNPKFRWNNTDIRWEFYNGTEWQPWAGTNNPQPETTFGDGTQPTSITLDSGDNDASLIVDQGTLNSPTLRFNHTTQVWEYSNDGVTYLPIGSGGGEPTYAIYTATSLSPGAGPVILNFSTKVNDTDDAVTTGASWKFTTPVGKGGLYVINVFADHATANSSILSLYKNNSSVQLLSFPGGV